MTEMFLIKQHPQANYLPQYLCINEATQTEKKIVLTITPRSNSAQEVGEKRGQSWSHISLLFKGKSCPNQASALQGGKCCSPVAWRYLVNPTGPRPGEGGCPLAQVRVFVCPPRWGDGCSRPGEGVHWSRWGCVPSYMRCSLLLGVFEKGGERRKQRLP